MTMMTTSATTVVVIPVQRLLVVGEPPRRPPPPRRHYPTVSGLPGCSTYFVHSWVRNRPDNMPLVSVKPSPLPASQELLLRRRQILLLLLLRLVLWLGLVELRPPCRNLLRARQRPRFRRCRR